MDKTKNAWHSAKDKYNAWSQKLSEFIRLDRNKSAFRKTMSSVWALIFGVLIALIFIAIMKSENPFLLFSKFGETFQGKRDIAAFLTFFIIFGFAGVSSAIGFKSGLFNIGISGQMMFASTIVFSMFIALGIKNITVGYLILSLLISILAGAFLAGIAGILKAYLNVHEVISTIMLNWVVAKLNRVIFSTNNNLFFSQEKVKTFLDSKFGYGTETGVFTIVNSQGANTFNDTQYIFGIIFTVIFLVLAIGLFFMYKSTTIGYKLKMLGLSKTNGQYIGVNEKMSVVYVMIISGAFAGVAGFFYYFFNQNIKITDTSSPLALGFVSIAISLLALNSSIGVIFTAIFYALLYKVQPALQGYPLYITADEMQVITSIILYLAAIAQLFMEFKPFGFLFKTSLNFSSRVYWLHLKRYFLKRKYLNAIKQYALKKEKLNQNSALVNKEQTLSSYHKLKDEYYYKIEKLNKRITLLDRNIQAIETIQKYKADLFFETLVLRRISKTYKKDTNLNQTLNDLKIKKEKNKKTYQALLKNYKEVESKVFESVYVNEIKTLESLTLTYDDSQFRFSEISKKDEIKKLNKEFKQMQNKFLEESNKAQKASNNSEILNIFGNISNIKKDHFVKLQALNADNRKNIKMQYKADLIDVKKEFKTRAHENYQFIKKHYFTELLSSKAESKGVVIC